MPKANLKIIKSLEQQIATGKKIRVAYATCGYTDSIVLACSIKLDK
jgi:hypothetical protein